MKRTIIMSLLAVATVIGYAGCASDGGDKSASADQPKKVEKPKDKRPINERITLGMTKDDVIAACGKPRSMSTSSDMGDTWIYSDAEKAFIPYYSLSGGQFHQVIVNFDKDGKVTKVDTQTTSRY